MLPPTRAPFALWEQIDRCYLVWWRELVRRHYGPAADAGHPRLLLRGREVRGLGLAWAPSSVLAPSREPTPQDDRATPAGLEVVAITWEDTLTLDRLPRPWSWQRFPNGQLPAELLAPGKPVLDTVSVGRAMADQLIARWMAAAQREKYGPPSPVLYFPDLLASSSASSPASSSALSAEAPEVVEQAMTSGPGEVAEAVEAIEAVETDRTPGSARATRTDSVAEVARVRVVEMVEAARTMPRTMPARHSAKARRVP